MAENPPYMLSHGTLSKALQKIKDAATPERFTHDFLANTLKMRGGTPKPVIPFLKRIGFLGSDGVPTELYKLYRNPAKSGVAVAQAMQIGYKILFDMNEKAHELSDEKLRGLIVQATGLKKDSRVVYAIVGSFKALRDISSSEKFDKNTKQVTPTVPLPVPSEPSGDMEPDVGFNLSYTINLNLPSTSDINVFNAIFKSLKENLLRK